MTQTMLLFDPTARARAEAACLEHALTGLGGHSKASVKAQLWELTKMPARQMAVKDLYRVQASRRDEFGEIGPDTLLTLAPRPEDICLLIAGGPGTHSVYAPSFGNTRAVTREVLPPR